MGSHASLQASRPSGTTQGSRDIPPVGMMVGLGKSTVGAEGGGLGDPGHIQTQCAWGQLDEAFNCAGSGVLVAIHHNPAQMLKIGQMNHVLKVPVSADYKGSLG